MLRLGLGLAMRQESEKCQKELFIYFAFKAA